MKTYKLLGENLKAHRFINHLSQQALAKKAKVSQSTVAQIEGGSKAPSLETIIRLSKALELEPWELLKPSEFKIQTI